LEIVDDKCVKECLLFNQLKNNTESKLRAVSYCRLSSGVKTKNGYDRQKHLIKKYAGDEYEIDNFFCETITGVTQLTKRKEIKYLLEYCKHNEIGILFVSELDRIGRTKDVIVEGISFLLRNDIKEIHVIKDNLIVNQLYMKEHYRTLLSIAKKCEDDRNSIIHRLTTGRDTYIANSTLKNVKMGRPSTYRKTKENYEKQYANEIDLLNKGLSLRNVSLLTGTSINTLRKIKSIFIGTYINERKQNNFR